MSGATPAYAGQRIQASFYNDNIVQPWIAATLENSWTNSGTDQGVAIVTAQYRLFNQVTCEIIGVVEAGTVTADTTVFTLPSGYYNPVNEFAVPMFQWDSTAGAAMLLIKTNGIVGAYNATSGDSYFYHGFIPLDA